MQDYNDRFKNLAKDAPFEQSPVMPNMLDGDTPLKFRCHKDVKCWNVCCGNIDITLTPYDILRLKNRLNMKAADFLAQYTRMELHDKSGLPMVIMDMPRFDHHCPFVKPVTGCTVYKDRPATCRYYPIGQGRAPRLASLKTILERLAQKRGGRAFFGDSVDKLDAVFAEILEELSNQYLLGYVPHDLARDGRWRTLRVEVPAPWTIN